MALGAALLTNGGKAASRQNDLLATKLGYGTDNGRGGGCRLKTSLQTHNKATTQPLRSLLLLLHRPGPRELRKVLAKAACWFRCSRASCRLHAGAHSGLPPTPRGMHPATRFADTRSSPGLLHSWTVGGTRKAMTMALQTGSHAQTQTPFPLAAFPPELGHFSSTIASGRHRTRTRKCEEANEHAQLEAPNTRVPHAPVISSS